MSDELDDLRAGSDPGDSTADTARRAPHRNNDLNDLSGEEWLYFTKSVLTTPMPHGNLGLGKKHLIHRRFCAMLLWPSQSIDGRLHEEKEIALCVHGGTWWLP
jgi:hypothetical protein